MSAIAETPKSIKAAQWLFFTNAVVWLLFSGESLITMTAKNSVQLSIAWIIAILMLGNAGAMLAAGIGLGRRQRAFFYFGIAVLIVNILLTITDEFGVLDAITLIIDLVLLGLLIGTRRLYFPVR